MDFDENIIFASGEVAFDHLRYVFEFLYDGIELSRVSEEESHIGTCGISERGGVYMRFRTLYDAE